MDLPGLSGDAARLLYVLLGNAKLGGKYSGRGAGAHVSGLMLLLPPAATTWESLCAPRSLCLPVARGYSWRPGALGVPARNMWATTAMAAILAILAGLL